MKKLKDAIAEYERLLRLKAKYNMAIHATLNETGAFSGKLQFLNKSSLKWAQSSMKTLTTCTTRWSVLLRGLMRRLKLADEALNNV